MVRAIGFEEFGGPEVLREVNIPAPKPGPDEVRVRVSAATVNNGDIYQRKGLVPSLRHAPPWVAGMEVAGVVESVGASVGGRFVPGDRVIAHVNPVDPRGGAYAELAVAAADRVVLAPEGASDAEAATLPMNGLTAWLLLEAMDLPPNATVAVIGAAGAVGGYVVQLARAAGHTVIADASPSDVELVQALGADVVVPRGDQVVDAILRASGGSVNGIAVSAGRGADLDRVVRTGGVVATAIGLADPAQLARAQRNGVRVVPVRVDLAPDPNPALSRLRELAQSGALSLRVADELPAIDAAVAHRRLEAGGLRGRQVLRFD